MHRKLHSLLWFTIYNYLSGAGNQILRGLFVCPASPSPNCVSFIIQTTHTHLMQSGALDKVMDRGPFTNIY